MQSGLIVGEQAGVRMMKKYFEIETSKSTPQYGCRKGLEIFGDEGYQAAKNELKVNLLRRGCINMLPWEDFTWDIRKQALGSLIFLKRKQSREMKGRGCANGRSQQKYITKEGSSSPTVSLYTIMGSYMMDALDNRKVITVDIPGVFLHRDWPQDKHPGYIMFEGDMVEMICKIDLTYYKNVIWIKDCKKKFRYDQLIKAVYGTLLRAIIFYNKLSKNLIDHGFVQNNYNMCTFNKMLNSEQKLFDSMLKI